MLGRRAERRDLLAEHRVGGHPLALGLAEPVVDLLQRLGDRLVIALERGLGEVEERRAIVLERLGGERLKRLAQPRVRLVEQLLRGAERLLVPFNLLAQPLVVLLDRGELCRERASCFGQLAAGKRADDHRRHDCRDRDRDDKNQGRHWRGRAWTGQAINSDNRHV